MDDETLVHLRENAERVGRDQRDYEAAVSDERRGIATFLDALRVAMKPALPAISSRIGADQVHHNGGPTDVEPRGVELIAGFGLAAASDRAPSRPTLYLLENGDFALLDELAVPRGHALHDLGDAGLRAATEPDRQLDDGQVIIRVLDHDVTGEYIAEQWRARGVLKIVEALREALDKQQKIHRPRPTPRKRELADRARRMAARLQAVTVLLRDP